MVDDKIARINSLINQVNYTSKPRGLYEVKRFLSNPENRKLDIYDEVEELYDSLMLGVGMW